MVGGKVDIGNGSLVGIKSQLNGRLIGGGSLVEVEDDGFVVVGRGDPLCARCKGRPLHICNLEADPMTDEARR